MILARAEVARGFPAGFAPVALALGSLAVALKPVTVAAAPTLLLVGAIGVLLPGARDRRARTPVIVASIAAGVAAFWFARATSGAPGIPAHFTGVWLTTLAAVAEEAFFRRAMYAWVLRWGAAAAVVATAIAFSLIHAPLYGAAAIPINLGAGLLFGWQRWATGTWLAPAATHVAANLLMLAW